MKKEIKIKIKGIHESPEGEIEPVEVIALGQMFDKDGFLCITYEEAIDEGDDGVVSRVSGNLLKIRDDQVEIIREGPAKSHMSLYREKLRLLIITQCTERWRWEYTQRTSIRC